MTTCHHIWSIETQEDGKAVGVCKVCGEKREFQSDLTTRQRQSAPLCQTPEYWRGRRA